MKVLSIIGMVLSLFGVLVGLSMMNMRSLTEGGNVMAPCDEGGMVMILLNLFFLAFSITATAVSFRRKKEIR
jgi:hypothetical protein